MRNEYSVVGYVGKSGQVRAYKLVGECADKFHPGKKRAHLKSFGPEPIDFWVPAEKLTAPPPRSESSRRRSGCSCGDGDCCRPCRCDSHCNCRGGNIYDC